MRKLSNYFYEKSSLIISIVSILVVFGFIYLILVPQSNLYKVENAEIVSLGTSFGFNKEMVMSFFQGRTTEMLHAYSDLLWIWDNIFAILYGLMNILLISNLFKPFKTRFELMNIFPALQSVLDWIENINLGIATKSYIESGEISNLNASMASIANVAKWSCSGIVYILLAVGIILRIVSRFKQKA